MKKVIRIIIPVVLVAILYVLFHNYLPPYSTIKSARNNSGLKLAKDLFIVKDTSAFSFTGEGYSETILSLDENQYKLLLKKNKLEEFKALPISEKLPPTLPEYFYAFMERDSLKKYYNEVPSRISGEISGFYSLDFSTKNESYKLTVIDGSKYQVLIYSFYD